MKRSDLGGSVYGNVSKGFAGVMNSGAVVIYSKQKLCISNIHFTEDNLNARRKT